MELMEQASRLYLQHDYKDAIGPYSKALELEKVNPKLEKPFWYVLVDNLGMSYGITGDLQTAKETFDYCVSKDPTYPSFITIWRAPMPKWTTRYRRAAI